MWKLGGVQETDQRPTSVSLWHITDGSLSQSVSRVLTDALCTPTECRGGGRSWNPEAFVSSPLCDIHNSGVLLRNSTETPSWEWGCKQDSLSCSSSKHQVFPGFHPSLSSPPQLHCIQLVTTSCQSCLHTVP